MTSSPQPQPAQPLFFDQVVNATDEELTALIRDHPWYNDPNSRQALHVDPSSRRPDYEQVDRLVERFNLLRKQTLAPPYPITKERLELAARWRKIRSSAHRIHYEPRPPFIGPNPPRFYREMQTEKTAYKLLVELGGRPVYHIDRFDEIRSSDIDDWGLPMAKPWKHLDHLLLTFDDSQLGERLWQTFLRQLKNWERFRTWQRDHRGSNQVDTYHTFVQGVHRDLAFLRWEYVYELWCEEVEEDSTIIWREWGKRERDRATYREHGYGEFASYSEAVRRRLESHGFNHPFQLHEDPLQQDPLTTWIEYLCYEYWWLDHYSEALETLQKEQKEVWDRVVADKLFNSNEGYFKMETFSAEGDLIYTANRYFWFSYPLGAPDKQMPKAEEAFRKAKSLFIDKRDRVKREYGEPGFTEDDRSRATATLQRLLRKGEKARADLRHASLRKKHYETLRGYNAKIGTQSFTRHRQRALVNWALDELRLVLDEVQELPGSCDIPMIAASRRNRKRARFTKADPAIRLFSSNEPVSRREACPQFLKGYCDGSCSVPCIGDYDSDSDSQGIIYYDSSGDCGSDSILYGDSDGESQAKRQRLALNESCERSRSSWATSGEQDPARYHDASLATNNNNNSDEGQTSSRISNDQIQQGGADNEHSITVETPISPRRTRATSTRRREHGGAVRQQVHEENNAISRRRHHTVSSHKGNVSQSPQRSTNPHPQEQAGEGGEPTKVQDAQPAAGNGAVRQLQPEEGRNTVEQPIPTKRSPKARGSSKPTRRIPGSPHLRRRCARLDAESRFKGSEINRRSSRKITRTSKARDMEQARR